MITRCGLGRMFEDASLQAAGKVRLFNTPRWLAEQTSRASIEESRKVKLASFNAYRTLCGYPPIDDLRQISSSGRVVREVGRRYDSARELELYVGLFAEDVRPNSVLPPLMGRLVGVHAFSQLMTNPLLAPLVYNAETFSPEGKEIIESTASLEQLVHRNVPGDSKPYVSLTRKSYRRERTSLLRRPQTPRTRS